MNLRTVGLAVPTTLLLCLAFTSFKKPDRSELRNVPPVQLAQSTPRVSAAAVASFTSVELAQDAATWSKITSAFQKELLPDQPTPDPHASVYPAKQIVRIWRYGDAALVVLEKRTDKKDREEWDRPFELYNFNLSTYVKSQITTKEPLWLWRVGRSARFEDGPAPDIAFEYSSCVECDPGIDLGALRFDTKEQKWELRHWLKGNEGVEVAVALDDDESLVDYGRLYGIADFEGKGHDEVAVWTHSQNFDEKDPKKLLPAVTTLSLYGFQNGTPTETEIKDPSGIKHIKKLLCQMDASNDACKKP